MNPFRPPFVDKEGSLRPGLPLVDMALELRRLGQWLKSGGRRPILIIGPAGMGKTTLASHFVRQSFLIDNVYWVALKEGVSPSEEFRELFDSLAKREGTENCVVVVDGAEVTEGEAIWVHVSNLRQSYPGVRVILTSRRRIRMENVERVHLAPLSVDDSTALLGVLLEGVEGYDRERLSEVAHMTGGNPLVLSFAARYLEAHDVGELGRLESFRVYGPSKAESEEEAGQLIQAVRPQILVANDQLVELLKRSPQDIHKLSARRFEELVAELLSDMGWEVQLTRATRDGGVDILARMDTEIGSLLTLVEAKKYDPDRPVGVAVVRELFGTLIDYEANSGLLVTTSRFTRPAHEFREKHKYLIELRDYFDLLDWLGMYKRIAGGNKVR